MFSLALLMPQLHVNYFDDIDKSIEMIKGRKWE